jgi:sulfur transfer protein SufE
MTINEVQDNIIEEFTLFDDWMDKYNQLIEKSGCAPNTTGKKYLSAPTAMLL